MAVLNKFLDPGTGTDNEANFAGTVDLSSSTLTLPNVVVSSVTNKAAATLAVPITHKVVTIETGGAEALTLADGTEGQELVLIMITDGGDGTLTPTNLGNGSTLTFDDVGDSAHLVFVNSAWYLIGTPTATLA